MIEVEDCQILAMKKDDYDKMSDIQRNNIIFNYIICNFKDYNNIWFCIPKDKLEKIYNKRRNN
jgi:hypothetical protein